MHHLLLKTLTSEEEENNRKFIEYPSEPDEDMPASPLHDDWIEKIKIAFLKRFQNMRDFWVGYDMFWYPERTKEPGKKASVSISPDVMIVKGIEKGKRRDSYLQFEENNIAPILVVEIISESESKSKQEEKSTQYWKYGVKEYWMIDPNKNTIQLYERGKTYWVDNQAENIKVSRITGFILKKEGDGISVYNQIGELLITGFELSIKQDVLQKQLNETVKEKELAVQRADTEKIRADSEKQRAEAEKQRAEAEKQRAETEKKEKELAEQRAETEKKEKELAEQRAETEKKDKVRAEQRAEKLAAQLKALGIDPDA